jgi:methylated-DNA-[protein]-cysteine S-methyltransferase
MSRINIQYYKTEIGELILGSFDGKLCLLDFRYRKMRNKIDDRIRKGLQAEFIERDNDFLRKVCRQVDEYLRNERKEFDVPIITVGTDFQKQVWEVLGTIEYGKTISYLELAKLVGNEKAVRAVASANGANALGLIIPSHRVIESGGGLGGYAGGLPAKKRLLGIERYGCDEFLLR